jgi:hypothetical protein
MGTKWDEIGAVSQDMAGCARSWICRGRTRMVYQPEGRGMPSTTALRQTSDSLPIAS